LDLVSKFCKGGILKPLLSKNKIIYTNFQMRPTLGWREVAA